MKVNNERIDLVKLIVAIVTAIVVAAGVIILIKKLCEKHSICGKKTREYIDFGDDDSYNEWECDDEVSEAYEELPEDGSEAL